MGESNNLDNSSKGSTDDKVALMSRKFKQLMKKKGNFQHSSRQKDTRFKKKHKEKSHEIICLKCKKPGHMKVKCPRLKIKKALQGQEKKEPSDLDKREKYEKSHKLVEKSVSRKKK